MTELETDFTGNPTLMQPPRETLLAGSNSTRAWLKANFYGEPYPRVRLIFIGHGSGSKVPLISSIHHACQQDRPTSLRNSVPSFAEEYASFSLSNPESYPRVLEIDKNIRANVINFPGPIESSRFYVPFLTSRNAIFIITVDSSQQSSDKQLRRMVNYWLSMLHYLLDNKSCVHVILVITKAGDARPHQAQQQFDELLQELRYQYPTRKISIEERIYTTTTQPMDNGVQQLVKCLRKKASHILTDEGSARVVSMFRQIRFSSLNVRV